MPVLSPTAPFFLFRFLSLVDDASLCQELPTLYGVVHDGFVSGLLLLLDGEERILTHLRRHVPRRIRAALRHQKALLPGLLLQLLGLAVLDHDSPLPQQVRLQLFGRTAALASIGGTLVHPVDAIRFFPAAGSLQLALYFFLGSLLLDFLDALLRPLSLLERFLLFIVDSGLVLQKRRMERLLQVQIAAHFAGVRAVRPQARGSSCGSVVGP